MNTRKYSITAAALFLILVPPMAGADVLHLKNGKELKVEKAWQDSDQIWFILQGLKASIPQSKVARIESTSGVPQKPDASEDHDLSGIKQSNQHSPTDLLPDQIKPPAETDSAAPSQPLKADKALVLRKDGFNDLKWGTRLSALNGLQKKMTDSGLVDVIEYVRPTDVLKVGDAALTTVIYAFWKDQLYTVTIWTRGESNYNALREAVFNQFGKGTRIEGKGAAERYLWSEDLTDAMLKYENESQYGMLWMRSSGLDRKVKLAKISSPSSYLKWMKTRK